MWKSYFKTSVRTLMKTKGFTLINIFGLALGLSVFLLICFYVYDELSYDRYNVNASRIYRVDNDIKFGGVTNAYAITPAPMAEALKSDFPEVEESCRLKNVNSNQVRKGSVFISEPGMVYADPSIFKIFTLPMIEGTPFTALNETHTVVITEDVARKYFNRTNVVGEILVFNNNVQYKITGVIRNIPKQSHFNYDFFLSMTSLDRSRDPGWLDNEFNTYVLLRGRADADKLKGKLPEFVARHDGPQLESVLHINLQKFNENGNYIKASLFPLLKIHLQSNKSGELGTNGDMDYIYIFSVIAFSVLLVAGVNFMNLSTARSANRAREVGVRKVLGSPRSYLIAQFLTESLIVTAVATLIAFLLSWAMLPIFNQFSGKQFDLNFAILLRLVPFLLILIIFIALLAGIYPALFLSAFKPLKVLRGNMGAGFKDGSLRSVLVVFQFFISFFLIISTLVVSDQLKFIKNKDVGFSRDQVLIIRNLSSLGDHGTTFQEDIKRLAGVKNATLSGYIPTGSLRQSSSMFQTPSMDPKGALIAQEWLVDHDYIPTLGIRLTGGRNFSKAIRSDTAAVIINEAAAKSLNTQRPLGFYLYIPDNVSGNSTKKMQIIGIVKDFNFTSLRDNVTPLALMLGYDDGALCVHIKSNNLPLVMSQIKAKWSDYSTTQQIDYVFMDEEFNNLYRAEQRVGSLTTVFTTLAIIIACLGLFGLAAFAAEQKKKEIGIRKVLGANVVTITAMLSKQFIKLVFIAIAIAIPPAWWTMHSWLNGFAYKENVGWWVFLFAGLSAIIIAIITVSFQFIKAALVNPIKSLKSD